MSSSFEKVSKFCSGERTGGGPEENVPNCASANRERQVAIKSSLPRDLEALIVAQFEQFQEAMESNSELRMALFERIFNFAETLRKSKN